MSFFQLNSFSITNTAFRKIVLLITLLFYISNLGAQGEHNIKLGIEAGFLPLSEDSYNLGLFLNIEPKIKIAKNTFMGLRFGLTLNSHNFENSNSFQFQIDEEFDNAVFSFVPIFDYYFNISHIQPYLGAGIGYHVLPHGIEVYSVVIANPTGDIILGKVNNRLGLLVRGGVELGKFRTGLEYSFIPKANIEIPSGEIIGTVGNSFWGLSFGVILGVGKDQKH